MSPVDVIAEIHKASGKAFLAHPHLIKNAQILKKVLEMNFDGIECYYGLAPYSVEKQWLKFAKKMNWLVSGGSDFHGNLNSRIELGCSWVRKENVVQIFGDL